MQILAEQVVNALQMGMLLFLISSGLSLIFGLMHVVNLAHGALYMVGAYFALTVMRGVGSFMLALVVAPLLTAAVGALLERLLLRRTYGRGMHPQVLLTWCSVSTNWCAWCGARRSRLSNCRQRWPAP